MEVDIAMRRFCFEIWSFHSVNKSVISSYTREADLLNQDEVEVALLLV
jgi:hypothetical protein